MAQKPIPIKEMVGVIAAHLVKLGFRPVHKSNTGSRYLVWPGTPWQIRVADHKWSGFNTTRQAQVVKSVILRPTPAADTYLLAVEYAVAFIARARVRQGLIGKGARTSADELLIENG